MKAMEDGGRSQGEIEQLRKEVHGLNEELVRVKDESDRCVFTAYSVFPLTSDGVALAKAYRTS